MTAINLDRVKPIAREQVRGVRVIVRADLNVPVQGGKVTDATRLERLAPGLRDLAVRGARVVVISHFGRPDGKPEPKYSLRPVAETLIAMVRPIPARFVPACVGETAADAVNGLENGSIAILENLRFHAGEEANDPAFAEALRALGDLYVNDAFSAAHRAHASTEGLARLLPAYAGPLMMEEIGALQAALEAPKRPTAAIVGGAKVSTKIALLKNLAAKVDTLIIGGGMANTFLAARGLAIGRSLAEPTLAATAREIEAGAKAAGCEVILPSDAVIARELKPNAPHETVAVGRVPADAMILDVGAASVEQMSGALGRCATVLWNGPLGAFETEPFGRGTFALARAVAARTRSGALTSVAGGGDTVAALNAAGVTRDFTYVSTAGGAFLEWLEGRVLPGIAALSGTP